MSDTTDDRYDDDEYDDDEYDDELAPEGNRIVGARALAVAELVTRSIAEDADAVDIHVEERRDGVALLVHASQPDIGRLIGKRGRVVQALRQVVRAAGSTEGLRATIDVEE